LQVCNSSTTRIWGSLRTNNLRIRASRNEWLGQIFFDRMAANIPPVGRGRKVDQNLILTTAGQYASILVLFPIVGYCGTVFSFYLNPRLERFDVVSFALDHSIPWLAASGAAALGLTTLVTVLAMPSVRFHERPTTPVEDSSLAKRLLKASPWFIPVVLILLFFNFLVTISVLVLVIIPASLINKRLTTGPFEITRMAGPLLLSIIFSALLVSTFGQNLDTGSMRFAKSAGVANGYYSIVASEGDQVILLPCDGNQGVISVNNESLLSVKYSSLNTPDLFYGLVNILRTGKWQLPGAQTHCPVKSP
jgi:hypothetical protein